MTDSQELLALLSGGLQGTNCNIFRLLSFVYAVRDQGWPNVFQQQFLSCSLKVLLGGLGIYLCHLALAPVAVQQQNTILLYLWIEVLSW